MLLIVILIIQCEDGNFFSFSAGDARLGEKPNFLTQRNVLQLILRRQYLLFMLV